MTLRLSARKLPHSHSQFRGEDWLTSRVPRNSLPPPESTTKASSRLRTVRHSWARQLLSGPWVTMCSGEEAVPRAPPDTEEAAAPEGLAERAERDSGREEEGGGGKRGAAA